MNFSELDKTLSRSAINAFNNTSLSIDEISQRIVGLNSSTIDYLSTTEKGKASINGLNTFIDASSNSMNIASLKAQALSIALNTITNIAIVAIFQGITLLLDNFIVTLDEQKQKLEDTKSKYEDSSSALSSFNSELQTTKERIDELSNKKHLTFTEKDELTNLKQSNDELERKIFLQEKINHADEKNVAEEAQNLYKKYANGRTIDLVGQIDFYTDNSLLEHVDWDNFKNDLPWLIAQYNHQQGLLKEAQDNDWDSLENNARENINLLESYMAIASQDYSILYETMSGLSEFSMTDELNEAKVDLNEILDLVAQILGYQNSQKQSSFDDIWNSKDFDKNKKELIEFAKKNELTSDVFSSNEKYKSLIDETGNEVEETIEHIYALVGDMPSTSLINLPAINISESISQISSQLRPQFDALTDAYQKIFTPDGFTPENINNDLLESLLSSFTNINKELGISFDVTELENFFSILLNGKSTSEQVQEAFNDLASSYLYSTDVMEQLNETTANSIIKQLEEMGISNAHVLVTDALNLKNEALLSSKRYLTKENKELSNATWSEIAAFGAEEVASNNCSQALALYYLKKSLLNSSVISNDEDINNILLLAEAAGVTSSSLSLLQNAKADYNRAISAGNDAEAQRAEQRLLRASESVKEEISKIKAKVSFNTGNSNPTSASSSAGAAGKEAADATVTAFEEQYKKLKDIRDRDKINEKQYLDTLRAMNERYFKGNEKYIDEYNKYQKEYLDGMRDLYESVISDVVKQIDKQIDSLNDQKDAAVDSLKSQQEAAKEALEAQKDAIEEQIKLIDKQIDSKQAQIDAINEENEARENAINLEKEQYELERLRNQRTEYVYSGKDKGFIYQTDTGAIRDQEQAVKEAEDQIRIADIEKEISLLEKKKEVLEEQQDAISEQIDRVDEYYEQLISNTESYWDAQIDGAEETKSRWEELQELQEEMEMNARLLSIGISQEDIENLSNDELLERVREKYLGILSDIYAGNKEMLSSLSDLTGIDVSALPSFLQDTQGYMDILSQGVDFANLNDSLGIVIDQFANVAAAAGQMTGSVIGSTGIHLGTNTDTKTSAGTGDVSFIDAVKQLEDESVPVINNVADAFAGEESSEDSSQSIVGSVNKAKAAIAGSSSGKKDSSEGSEGNGEDSGSLLEAMAAQSQAALDEETGIPAQIQKWQELNNVLSAILSNLMNIAAVISTMNATDTSINSGSPLGPALAKGGISHGTRNAMVSEYNQLETIIHKNGTYEITSSPTLTDLSPGDQVLNNSQTLALIRKKREASARGTNGVFLGDTHSVLSSVPELQLHNTILDNSLASMASMQLLGNDNKNSLINVSIGDVILENVQNADTLSKQIVMRLPTQIKQELSKRG